MTIPTEPIGSIPRPVALIEAIKSSGSTDPALDPLFKEARFTLRALTLNGRRFETRPEATAALRSEIDPVVKSVYDDSKRWDVWQHHPRENGRYLGKDE